MEAIHGSTSQTSRNELNPAPLAILCVKPLPERARKVLVVRVRVRCSDWKMRLFPAHHHAQEAFCRGEWGTSHRDSNALLPSASEIISTNSQSINQPNKHPLLLVTVSYSEDYCFCRTEPKTGTRDFPFRSYVGTAVSDYLKIVCSCGLKIFSVTCGMILVGCFYEGMARRACTQWSLQFASIAIS